MSTHGVVNRGRRQGVAVTLLEDCVFSARAATAGGHESLDRIPGQVLLGAAAAKLYGRMDRRRAFDAFHSGRLRFGDGLPFDGREAAWPVPLAWHHPKEKEPDRDDGRLEAECLHNFLHLSELPDGRQPEQLRKGYVYRDGRRCKPARGLRLKTAIEPGTGRAAEGQLFGYDALARGQRFAAVIEADADFDGALFDEVIDALTGDALLGRSRSAEYGRARLEPVDLTPLEPGPPDREGETVLWLLSDLAVVDDRGQPTLTPDGASFGLPEAEVDWGRTFLRSRRYSPWNAYRGGFDHERWVLSAGGVITLRHDGPLSVAVRTRLQAGVGLHREGGMGRLWVDPPLLRDPQPDFATPAREEGARRSPKKPADPLIQWLESRAGEDWKAKAEREAKEIADDYLECLKAGRNQLGIPDSLDFGPSKSQWGRVLGAAKEKSGRELHDALFDEHSGVAKPRAEGWREMTVTEDNRFVTLAEWLKKRLETSDGFRDVRNKAYAHTVRRLARRVQDDLSRRRA